MCALVRDAVFRAPAGRSKPPEHVRRTRKVRPGRGGNGNGRALRLGTNPDARVCRDGRWSENRREYPWRVI